MTYRWMNKVLRSFQEYAVMWFGNGAGNCRFGETSAEPGTMILCPFSNSNLIIGYNFYFVYPGCGATSQEGFDQNQLAQDPMSA